MGEIIIREYKAEDFPRLCEIHDPARRIELKYANLSDAFIPLTIAAEREGLFDYRVCVAELDGIVCGFIAFHEDELGWLYVDTEYSRRGIGRSLVAFMLAQAPQDSNVSLEVLFGNDPAIALYKSMGFEISRLLSGVMPGNESFAVSAYEMIYKGEKQ